MANKILVALDNSTVNRVVFDEALTIAKAMEAHLRILHVIPLGRGALQDSPGQPAHLTPFLFDQGEDSLPEEHLFKQYVSEAIHAGIHTEFFQYAGEPGKIICNFARVWEANLIIMGRRGHSSMSELMMGSVSDYVIHHAPCSVQIVYCLERNQSNAVQMGQTRVVY